VKWLNVQISNLRHPAYVGSEPVARATWLNVSGYCADQENGGRIIGARAWKCRQWQQTCGVMLAEIDQGAPLLTWDGDDLIVWEYPVDQEETMKHKRLTAIKNGRKGGRRKPTPETKKEPTLVPTSVPTSAPTLPPTLEAIQEPTANQGRQAKRNSNSKGNGNSNETLSRSGRGAAGPAAGAAGVEVSPLGTLIGMWKANYAEKHSGEAYAMSDRDAAALKRLLATSGMQPFAIMRVAVAAWTAPVFDPFLAKQACTMADFAAKFNAIREELNRRRDAKGRLQNGGQAPNHAEPEAL
jgi:hypothetical protein